nr:hypothetical protein [Streptomyces sp. MBT62]
MHPVKEHVAPTLAIGRLAHPEKITAVVAFLASDQSNYVFGANWSIGGGEKQIWEDINSVLADASSGQGEEALEGDAGEARVRSALRTKAASKTHRVRQETANMSAPNGVSRTSLCGSWYRLGRYR